MITKNNSVKIFLYKKKKHIAKIKPELCKLIPSKKLKALMKSKKHTKVQTYEYVPIANGSIKLNLIEVIFIV